MEAVAGLLMLLLGASHGVETFCDGRQDGAQCHAALGGTLVLRLMTSASDIFKYQWFKNEERGILHGRKNIIVHNKLESRSSFTLSNGTFRISNISWTDEAEYTLQIFDSNGKETEQRKLNVSIQVPVSSPLLASECLSQGDMWVSCSSEGGDGPQYSWTLDGRTLTDRQLLSGNNQTNIITLKQGVSGQLVCSVQNHVSTASASQRISPCAGFIFINCTLSNGEHVSQWVSEDDESFCITRTTTVFPGVETFCDGRQDGAQCHATLGGTLFLRLMTSASDIFKYQWLKNKELGILHGRKNIIVHNELESRSSFAPSDGTFRISNISWTDEAEYALLTYASSGILTERRKLNISVQDFILVNCTLSNGPHVSQWVFEDNKPQCITPAITTGMILRVVLSLAAVLIVLVLVVEAHRAQKIKKNTRDDDDDQDVSHVHFKMVECEGRQRAPAGDDEIEQSSVHRGTEDRQSTSELQM